MTAKIPPSLRKLCTLARFSQNSNTHRTVHDSLTAVCSGSKRSELFVLPVVLYRSRHYSTHSQSNSSKQQIIVSAAPPKKWRELTAVEKVVRTTSTGANLLVIIAGFVVTGLVGTFLYLEVLSPDSKTAWFNRAVSRVKKDPRCTVVLGEPSSLTAYGEPTLNKWARSRPLASSTNTDRYGTEHLLMHFNVEGSISKGTVGLHVIKRRGESDYHYIYLFLDIPGHQRIYLENSTDESGADPREKKGLFGIRWSW